MRRDLLRSVVLVLVVAAGFGLGACGDSGSGEDGAATTTDREAVTPPTQSGGESAQGTQADDSADVTEAPSSASGTKEPSSDGGGSEGEEDASQPDSDPIPSTPAPTPSAAPVDPEQVQQVCEARQPDLPADTRAVLDRICDAADAGDEEALREAVAAVCRKLVINSTEEGSTERRAGLESCVSR